MVTPETPGPSPKKVFSLLDSNSNLGPSDQIFASSPLKNTFDESSTSDEQDMITKDCVALVKSEDMEMVAGEDFHQGLNQVPTEWKDLERYVIVIKGCHGSGGRSFQCSLCGKVMNKSLPRTMAHVEAKHFRDLFTHTCDICQETFKTKAILMTHIKRNHKD